MHLNFETLKMNTQFNCKARGIFWTYFLCLLHTSGSSSFAQTQTNCRLTRPFSILVISSHDSFIFFSLHFSLNEFHLLCLYQKWEKKKYSLYTEKLVFSTQNYLSHFVCM